MNRNDKRNDLTDLMAICILLLTSALIFVSVCAAAYWLRAKDYKILADKPPEIEVVELVKEVPAVTEYVYVSADADNRYAGIELSESEIALMAKIVYLEAGNQPFSGQKMVAEVILNRVKDNRFPNTVTGVIYQPGQFSTAGNVDAAVPGDEQYEAVCAAINERPITDADVIYFSRGAQNSKVFCKLDDHVFCRG